VSTHSRRAVRQTALHPHAHVQQRRTACEGPREDLRVAHERQPFSANRSDKLVRKGQVPPQSKKLLPRRRAALLLVRLLPCRGDVLDERPRARAPAARQKQLEFVLIRDAQVLAAVLGGGPLMRARPREARSGGDRGQLADQRGEAAARCRRRAQRAVDRRHPRRARARARARRALGVAAGAVASRQHPGFAP
jgi:hypothetical protein